MNGSTSGSLNAILAFDCLTQLLFQGVKEAEPPRLASFFLILLGVVEPKGSFADKRASVHSRDITHINAIMRLEKL